MKTDAYFNPLTERYASAEMSGLFSAQTKFETWRRLWLWLAEEERRLGLPVSEEALAQMRAHLVRHRLRGRRGRGSEDAGTT